jgi:hypothetical protein
MDPTLIVSHHLYLTPKQRYALNSGKRITVIGISTPVWCFATKTSEPVGEIFTKYRLIPGEKIHMRHTPNGYHIQLPRDSTRSSDYHDEELLATLAPPEREELEQRCDSLPCIRNLLDSADGGSRWLAFRQFSQIKQKGSYYSVHNYVEMKGIEDLLDTLA